MPMDRRIGPQAGSTERRRIVAACELLERAEVLLPRDHPAAWHLAQALVAMQATWQATLPGRDAQTERDGGMTAVC